MAGNGGRPCLLTYLALFPSRRIFFGNWVPPRDNSSGSAWDKVGGSAVQGEAMRACSGGFPASRTSAPGRPRRPMASGFSKSTSSASPAIFTARTSRGSSCDSSARKKFPDLDALRGRSRRPFHLTFDPFSRIKMSIGKDPFLLPLPGAPLRQFSVIPVVARANAEVHFEGAGERERRLVASQFGDGFEFVIGI